MKIQQHHPASRIRKRNADDSATPRFHHIGAIILLPIALLLIAPQWGRARMLPMMQEYTASAEKEEQKMTLLETESKDLQRTKTLLTEGKEKILFLSVVRQHQREKFSSAAERYERAAIRTAILTERIAVLRSSINDITGNTQTIYIDLSAQTAKLIESGIIISQYPVSSGARATPTPKGRFQIYQKQKLRVSNLETPYRMPYYMAFTKNGSHGLHALPYLGSGPENSAFWHEARSHIGIPVSHGCVRFLPEDIVKIYEWAAVGTTVIIGS